MDLNSLLLSGLFGLVGTGYLLYGKSAGKFLPMGVGAGLMIVPCFVSSLLVTIGLCATLMAVPFLVHEG